VPARRHNLPAPHTQLFGREHDSATVRDLALQTPGRLVTLTGAGGSGKTQLALLVATSLIDGFRDGVWLVDLAPVQAADLVPQTVTSAVGVREQPGETASQTLVSWIGARSMLLVLDNCEHLIDACAQLAAALLDVCPNLRLLTTSREPLRISGERVWRVPSLSIPDQGSMLLPDQVIRFPSAQLFVQRAQAVKSDFAVTSHNAAAVSAICARLDGLPLAIELAAAWVRVLDVDQIVERLDNTFELLVGGSRSAPGRQQTMRAALDWSYGLLSEAERAVFQRLAVFVGGWGLHAAEHVCSGSTVDRDDVLAHLTGLVDASLVQVEERDERARYRLLEPVRQYAHRCLRASGELEAVRRQHAEFFLSYAERWEHDANYGGPGRQTAFAALEREQDNLRATLQWCLEHGDAEKGIFLGRALWTYWVIRGLNTEGRTWMSQLAALPDAVKAPAVQAVAQGIEATLAWRQGDYAEAKALLVPVSQLLPQAQVHAPRLVHSVPSDLASIAQREGDHAIARMHFEEALAAARAAGLRVDEALSLQSLGGQALLEGDYPRARALCEESLAIARAAGDAWAMGAPPRVLGWLSFLQGDVAVSHELLEQAVRGSRLAGDRRRLAMALDFMALVATATGQFSKAGEAFSESLQLREDVGNRADLADSLEGIAALAAAQGQPILALQLAGAAAGIRDRSGSSITPMRRTLLDQWLSPLQQALGQDVIGSAWETGRAIPVDQAVELALAATQPQPEQSHQPPGDSRQPGRELSPREQQVAALLAEGLTNREIADRLVITQRTVASHIEHILEKLGFASRHQVGVWVAEHGIQAEHAD
jgi:predicted ATPase/DNA-binding CsgD family transcriptional regulator